MNIGDNGGSLEMGGVKVSGQGFFVNTFARMFGKNRGHENALDNERIFNSQGYSQEELMFGAIGKRDGSDNDPYSNSGVSTLNVQFDQYFPTKISRLSTYRSMSKYPLIAGALDRVADEAIMEDPSGKIAMLEIRKEVPEHVEEELRKIFDYLTVDVMRFNETGWDLFRKWLVDGELFVEMVLNDEGNTIIDAKVLPAATMYPIYRDSQIIGFVQSLKHHQINQMGLTQVVNPVEGDIIFDRDQIVYIVEDTGTNKYDVCGFLEESIRPYNQLRQMEDAVVINKIVRAPARRLWNISTGNMNKTRGEEYVRGFVQRMKKRVKYDPTTGAMDASENFLALTEDYYFPKPDGSEGTTVSDLPGSTAFNDMEDVMYFRKNLLMTLKQPSSRWQSENPSIYSSGRSNEISREEIEFAQFVKRKKNKFKYLLTDAFITMLRLRGFDDRYVDYGLYNVKFTESNWFSQFKDLELLEARFNIFNLADQFVFKPEENENGPLALEFAMKRCFLMSDEEYNENLYLLNKTKNNVVEGQASDEDAVGGPAEAGADTEMGGESNIAAGGPSDDISTDASLEDTDAIPGDNDEEIMGVESFSFKFNKSKPTMIMTECFRSMNDTKLIRRRSKYEN